MKETTLDIRAMDEAKRQFDVEIQVTMDHSFLHRSLYYWSHLYYQQIDKGTKYHELRPVVCINLLDYNVYPEDPSNHHCFMLSDIKVSDRILTDHEVFHIIELQKPSNLTGRLRLWTELIENAGLEGVDMDVLISNDKILKIAHQEYERCAQDQELRELAFSRERFQRDWNSRIGYAEEEGLRRGMEKGLEKGIKKGIATGIEKGKREARQETLEETAGRMLRENMDIGLISKITGLTIKRIESLKKKN
jgi:predicted transposase/invertase (TIGR01784 family)